MLNFLETNLTWCVYGLSLFLGSIVTPPDPDGCASRILSDDLDLIFTDIPGAKKIIRVSGPHEPRYRYIHN